MDGWKEGKKEMDRWRIEGTKEKGLKERNQDA